MNMHDVWTVEELKKRGYVPDDPAGLYWRRHGTGARLRFKDGLLYLESEGETAETENTAVVVQQAQQEKIAPVSTSTLTPVSIPYEAEFKKITEIQSSDFYSVYDHRIGDYRKVPNARVLQRWANDRRISSEIVEIEKEDGRAKAIIRGWIGKKDAPIVETADAVILHIRDYEREWLLNNSRPKSNRSARAKYDTEKGCLVPATIEDAKELASYLLRRQIFLERDAITKARKRVQLQLLGVEWREEEEVEAEESDIEVNNNE